MEYFPIPNVHSEVKASFFLLDFTNTLFNNLQTPDLATSSSTTFIELTINKLAGDMPSSICSVRSSKALSFSKNNLVGSIPQCLGNLSSA
ncbi:hypothetical protein QQP08_021588 [Theobroma cacao]|nr:hypothetical protein QQP08_021588 [Theobroma cacao]